jgi:hypothetical protein
MGFQAVATRRDVRGGALALRVACRFLFVLRTKCVNRCLGEMRSLCFDPPGSLKIESLFGSHSPGEGNDSPRQGCGPPREGTVLPFEGAGSPFQGSRSPGKGSRSLPEGRWRCGEGDRRPWEVRRSPCEGEDCPGEGSGSPPGGSRSERLFGKRVTSRLFWSLIRELYGVSTTAEKPAPGNGHERPLRTKKSYAPPFSCREPEGPPIPVRGLPGFRRLLPRSWSSPQRSWPVSRSPATTMS